MNWKVICLILFASAVGHCDDNLIESNHEPVLEETEPSVASEPTELPLAAKKTDDDAEKIHKQNKRRISQLESDMQKVRGRTAYENYGAKTASANPQIDGLGFFITADFLWWKLYEGGTAYLLRSKNNTGALPVKGIVRHFNFDWEPGFKVGIGYLFELDGWDTNLEYTYYNTHAHHSSSFHYLFPLIGDESLQLIKSKGHWNVHFQNLNFLLGRNYFLSRAFAVHPLFGLDAAWIEQHRRCHFVTSSSDHISLKSRNDFWGIGPILCLNSRYYMGKDYSVYGNVSGNLLWGIFHIKEKETNTTSNKQFYNFHDHFHRIVPSVAFALGLCYETDFADDSYHFLLKAGYENQYWFRQNQLPQFDVHANTFHKNAEDLSMQGLTVELRLDF